MDPILARQCGIKLMLKQGAVPTIFDFPVPEAKLRGKNRKSTAILKRSALQKLHDIPNKKAREEDVQIPTPTNMPESDPAEEASEPAQTLSSDFSKDMDGKNEGSQVFNSFTQTTYNLIERRHVKLQTLMVPTTCDRGIQVNTYMEDRRDYRYEEEEEDQIMSDDDDKYDESDPDWMESDDSDDDYRPLGCSSDTDPSSEKKFIVYQNCLEQLFPKSCSDCGREFQWKERKVIGTCLFVKMSCGVCFCQWEWSSQPMSGTMPWGNLIIGAAILFSGSSALRVINMMNFASISCFSQRTYTSMQSAYLVPTISTVWTNKQEMMLDELRHEGIPLRLGGDARCCSPGHTAKFGSYTLMNLDTSKIVAVKLVQSNEVSNSYNMELEGLKRCMALLDSEGIDVSDLVTDRHSQVKAYMKEEHININHWFDVWHVAKGIYKKIEAASKKKGNGILGDWARSISNHIYWCAASSGGDGDLVRDKWLSILNHVVNIHEGHEGEHFPNCVHGSLDDRLWMRKGLKPHMDLERIITGRMLLTDIRKLSPVGQTSSLESFHKVVCYFAPKSVHFFHAQMEARLFLAALHFNENSCRQQAVTSDGRPKYAVSYPKAKHGDGIAKQVKVQQTFVHFGPYDRIDEFKEHSWKLFQGSSSSQSESGTSPTSTHSPKYSKAVEGFCGVTALK
ncbi:hypothetical protein FSP39_024743 [Pinctada imbricata]|uniref:Uncharacterized protein n=1 Tax=Pinctada imbricata TaxID=66713 RepID=A0AA88YUK6_PINIB|nr:hypothetical protein FSP39_024743 [Pinctada imbricata]